VSARAELGVDGNCGFALLGEDIQVGEAEFVEFATDAPKGSSQWERAAEHAATKALHKLEARLNKKLSYYIGPSHPRHLP
jgi:hypothetical protein